MVSCIFSSFTIIFGHLFDSCNLRSCKSVFRLKQESIITMLLSGSITYLKMFTFNTSYRKKQEFKNCFLFPNIGILTTIRWLLTSIYRWCHSLGGLVASFPPRWLRFEIRSRHVGFVADKVALGAGFLQVLQFLSSFIPLTAFIGFVSAPTYNSNTCWKLCPGVKSVTTYIHRTPPDQ
jgi:hypothetical protein